jgi:hypothetical protein
VPQVYHSIKKRAYLDELKLNLALRISNSGWYHECLWLHHPKQIFAVFEKRVCTDTGGNSKEKWLSELGGSYYYSCGCDFWAILKQEVHVICTYSKQRISTWRHPMLQWKIRP